MKICDYVNWESIEGQTFELDCVGKMYTVEQCCTVLTVSQMHWFFLCQFALSLQAGKSLVGAVEFLG